MNQKSSVVVLIMALVTVAVPLQAASPEGGGVGGGVVNNLLPSVPTFLNNEGGTAIVGRTDTLSGTVKDPNGEQDLATLRVNLVGTGGAETNTFTVDVSSIDWATETTEPETATNGWKVWNAGDVRDGVVAFKYDYTYATTGTFTFTVDGEDAQGFGTLPEEIIVSVTEAIEIATDFVNADGSADEGARWGNWTANPGATNVLASNFLKVVNTGDDDTQEFTVDFSDVAFGGLLDGTWTIDVDANIEFACAETQTGQAPQDLTFTFTPASSTGSATCAFTTGSNLGAGVLYVQYRVVEVPEPMMDQAYAASFTVSS